MCVCARAILGSFHGIKYHTDIDPFSSRFVVFHLNVNEIVLLREKEHRTCQRHSISLYSLSNERERERESFRNILSEIVAGNYVLKVFYRFELQEGCRFFSSPLFSFSLLLFFVPSRKKKQLRPIFSNATILRFNFYTFVIDIILYSQIFSFVQCNVKITCYYFFEKFSLHYFFLLY